MPPARKPITGAWSSGCWAEAIGGVISKSGTDHQAMRAMSVYPGHAERSSIGQGLNN